MDYSLYYIATASFSEILSWLFGIFVVGITILLAVGTAVDIAFLAIPVWQEKIFDKKNRGFSLVSNAAVSSLEEAAQTGQSAFALYFKRRLKVYILTSIVIYAVMSNMPIKLVEFLWGLIKVVLETLGILKG